MLATYSKRSLSEADYKALAEFRHQIRRFLHFSEKAAHQAGLEPAQHQLLLAIKGLADDVRPRIAELAARLQIQHHSTVELVNRLEAGGFVHRRQGKEDRREVLLELSTRGERVLQELSLHHKAELRSQGPALLRSLHRVIAHDRSGSRRKRRKDA